jgi:sugar/nucleoside kinase (ribokinase family)
VTTQEIDFIAFSLIIDDIVFPDGRTAMGVLGGGGPQTAFGLKLWADQVGLVSGVGADLPTGAMTWLKESGIDTSGLRSSAHWPTPRAWQLLEADGRRTQVWRVSGPAIHQQLGRSLDTLPSGYRHGLGYHLGLHPEEPDLAFIHALRATGPIVSLELFRAAQRPLTDNELAALLSAGHIFSLNQAEAFSLVGPGEPMELIQRLVQAGATIITLRQGAKGALVHRAATVTTHYPPPTTHLSAKGALVHHAATAETWRIPAIATNVVDPTGAGNAFCGGFLAGWVQTGNLRLAGLYGAVAASFLVEQVGLPPPQPDLRQLAQKRLAAWAGETDRIKYSL